MSATLRTANELCKRALRLIGAFSINDTAPNPNELNEALHQLDLLMRYLSGTEFLTFLFNTTVSFDLTADEASFDLIDRLGNNLPSTGYSFPLSCMLEDGNNGNRTKLELVGREEFDGLADPDQSGTPCIAHIDRSEDDPQMRVWPVPAVSTFDVYLTFTTFAPDLRPDSTKSSGNVSTGLRQAWELWAVEKTAWACGRGPVRRIPRGDLQDLKVQWTEYENRLITWENQEHTTEPPIAETWDVCS